MNAERPSQTESTKSNIRKRVETYVNGFTDGDLNSQFKPIIIDSVTPVLESPDDNALWALALEVDDEAINSQHGMALLNGNYGPLGSAWAAIQRRIALEGAPKSTEYAKFRQEVAIRIASLKLPALEEISNQQGLEKTDRYKGAILHIRSGVTKTLKNFTL